MTAVALFQRPSISLDKALLETAQVICIGDALPSFEKNVGLTNDGASRIAGNHERVQDLAFLRIDDLHRVPTLGSMDAILLVPQRDHRIHAHRPPRRNQACRKCHKR